MMPAHKLICCFRPAEGVESPLERYIKASKELDDCPTDMEHYMVKPVFMICNLNTADITSSKNACCFIEIFSLLVDWRTALDKNT